MCQIEENFDCPVCGGDFQKLIPTNEFEQTLNE